MSVVKPSILHGSRVRDCSRETLGNALPASFRLYSSEITPSVRLLVVVEVVGSLDFPRETTFLSCDRNVLVYVGSLWSPTHLLRKLDKLIVVYLRVQGQAEPPCRSTVLRSYVQSTVICYKLNL